MTLIILSYGIQDIPAKVKLISVNNNLLKSLLIFNSKNHLFSEKTYDWIH